MPIYGLTHDRDGSAILRRSVTTKLAIGLPPSEKHDQPRMLDHFVFQKKVQRGSGRNLEVVWEIDEEKTRHYGRSCREVEIILLDHSPDRIFRTEYAWWSDTQKECWGDGETATRRTGENPHGEPWEPCANQNCPDLLDDRCRPSGDLYFLLADYPTLGTIAKLHTSSYQSIREIYTALEDIRVHAGGELQGLRLKLFVRAERNVYRDDLGNLQQGMKHVLGLELAAAHVQQLVTRSLSPAEAFRPIASQLGGLTLDIEDPESERAGALKAEFYPASNIRPSDDPDARRSAPDAEPVLLDQKIEAAFTDLKATTAQRIALLDLYRGNLPGLLKFLRHKLDERKHKSESDPPQHTNGHATPKPRPARSRTEERKAV